MPAQRRFGMDHEHYDWSPLSTRSALRWPDGARVAVCVIVSLDHMEWAPPPGSFQAGNLAGGTAIRPFPDYTRMSHREYGHRVGIFRVLDALEKAGIPATVAMDALTAENYPYLVRHCLDRGCEIIAHGQSASRMITSNMTEQEERAYIQESVRAVTQATGAHPTRLAGDPSTGNPRERPSCWPRRESGTFVIGPTTSSPIRSSPRPERFSLCPFSGSWTTWGPCLSVK